MFRTTRDLEPSQGGTEPQEPHRDAVSEGKGHRVVLGLCYYVPRDTGLSRLWASTPFALGEKAEEGKPGTNPLHLLQSG